MSYNAIDGGKVAKVTGEINRRRKNSNLYLCHEDSEKYNDHK
jgi:hypothetical protein